MSSQIINGQYMSDYRDRASQMRLMAAQECGHYPKLGGQPCPFCVDRLIERAMREAREEMA